MDWKYVFLITISVVCLAWQIQCAVNCTATGAGRHADPDDTRCKNYTYCIYTPSGYVSYNYTCPSTSLFNPKTTQCTTNYTCTNSTTNSTTSFCKSEGRFPDPNLANCSGYIECINISGAFIETKFVCFNGTYYNPNTTDCEFNYKCPSSFTCSAAGRFPNTSDSTCRSYYFCIRLSDGSYVKHEYICPSISVFSPVLRLCTTSYTCP